VPGVAHLGEDGLERQISMVYRSYRFGVSAHVVRLYHPQHPFSEQEYIGATADLKRRIADHNAGRSTHSAKFKPWELGWYCAFRGKYEALECEKYLKSHSGRAFAKKRLVRNSRAAIQ